jgi:hypothetical protein
MSGINGDRAAHHGPARAWDALSSEHERLVLTAEDPAAPAGAGPAEWAELASQRERLIDSDAPLGGLASSAQIAPGLRLVVPTA